MTVPSSRFHHLFLTEKIKVNKKLFHTITTGSSGTFVTVTIEQWLCSESLILLLLQTSRTSINLLLIKHSTSLCA